MSYDNWKTRSPDDDVSEEPTSPEQERADWEDSIQGANHMPSQLYIVICGTREPYVAERDLKDMGREETIRDMARGEWGNVLTGERYRVSSIIELGTDRDCTAEFEAAALMQIDAYSTAAE